MQPSRDNIERTPTVVYYCDRASRAPIGAAPGSSRGEMNFEIPVLRCQERFEQYFYYSCAAVIVSLPLPPAAVVRPKTKYGVIFGSWSRGKACEWSDIDLLVVSPRFDDLCDRRDVDLLWRLAARSDSRIEPIPCGGRQWREDRSSAVVEIARREGEPVRSEEHTSELQSLR